MNRSHVISDEAMQRMQGALATGNNWIAYNEGAYFLDKEQMQIFGSKFDAISFAALKAEEHESFKVFYATSIMDVLKQIPYEQNNIQSLQNLSTMNEKNLEDLKKKLMYNGFGETFYPELEKNIRDGQPEFQLSCQAEFNQEQMDITLHFKKGDQNEMYFFNKFDASLDDKHQTFHMNWGNEITVKEAFNLLGGRAVNKDLVNKENQKYNAWIQLDFNNQDERGNYKIDRYHERYGYDLDKTVSAYPLKELADPKTKESLLQSLEKGNLQAVHMPSNGKEQMFFISANPKDRSIDIYDKQMKPVQHETLKAEQPEQKQEKKQEQKNDLSDDLDDGKLKKKRTHKKGMTP